jgi:hypothetical protein
MDACQYFFKVNDPELDRRPRGVLRRREVEGAMRDEVYDFKHDAWVATAFFKRHRLGHDDWDPMETSRSEAEAFIAETKRRRAERAV